MNEDEFATFLAERVHRSIESAMAPLRAELTVLREVVARHATIEAAETRFRAIEERFAALPAVKDGAPGKDADPDVMAAMIDTAVTAAVAAIPTAKDGVSVTVEDVAPMVADLVDQAVNALPAAKDGRGIASTGTNAAGELILHFTDGEEQNLGRIVGQDADGLAIAKMVLDSLPTPKDGRDGIATREEIVLAVREAVGLALPEMLEKAIADAAASWPRVEYKGVWAPGVYQKGNITTFGGSGWICKAHGAEGKPGESDDWQLFVRKGRDGRDRGKE